MLRIKAMIRVDRNMFHVKPDIAAHSWLGTDRLVPIVITRVALVEDARE